MRGNDLSGDRSKPGHRELLKQQLLGNSLMLPKAVTDRETMKKRSTVFVEAYTHDIADLDAPAKSLVAKVVIEGWWKLIIPGPVEPDRSFSGVPVKIVLFDLKSDPLEKKTSRQSIPALLNGSKISSAKSGIPEGGRVTHMSLRVAWEHTGQTLFLTRFVKGIYTEKRKKGTTT